MMKWNVNLLLEVGINEACKGDKFETEKLAEAALKVDSGDAKEKGGSVGWMLSETSNRILVYRPRVAKTPWENGKKMKIWMP